MNWDRFEGSCKQMGGIVKEQLGRFAHDPQREFAGKCDQFAGKNQQRYGVAKEEAARQLREFYARNRNWDPSRQ